MKNFAKMLFWKATRWVFGLGVILFCQSLNADQCTQVFTGGLQSTTSGNTIKFACGTQLLNNPTTVLPTTTISNPGGACTTKTCGATNCSASGGVVGALDLGTFQVSSNAGGIKTISGTQTLDGNGDTTTDYQDVTVSNGATLNFSANASLPTVYRFKSLTLNTGAVVNLQPGDYWIQTFKSPGASTINVVGNGTARIYVQNALSTGSVNLTWNSGGSASELLIYGYANLTFGGSTTQITGIIYSQASVTLSNNASVTGAIAADSITLNNTADVTYDSSAASNMDFGVTCPQVTQFGVNAPSTGTNCQNMTITVRAENASAQTITNYTGQITLTTQSNSGTWVSTTGGGALSSTVNGAATYQFVAADNGVASFQLSYPSSGTSPITLKAYQTNSTGVSGLSGAINFIPGGLLVTDVVVPSPPTAPPAAFSTAQTAGNNFTLYLTAYTASNCGIVTSYTGAKTIRFWTTYVNPTTGTINATINGTAIASSSGATQTTQSITFTNGVATITGKYADVGQLMLNVADTASGGPTGQSGNFVVKPAQFAINIPGNFATQTTAPPASAVSACLADAVFAKAGSSFTVNIQPQNAQGAVTPNYGNETVSQGILLQSSALLAPSPGRNGSTNTGIIGNGSAFTKVTGSAGPFSSAPYFTGSTFYFDEVGCINLMAGVGTGSYLGAGNVSSGVVVGRFTPHHFSVSGNTPQLTSGCSGGSGSFTYLDKAFLYNTQPILTVTAQALLNTQTQNYTGSFWKLANTALGNNYSKQYYPVNAGDTIPALSFISMNPTPAFLDGGDGSGTFTFSDGGGFTIQRLSGTLAPPFTAEIALTIPTITDTDSVPCTGAGCVSGGFAFGGTTSGSGIAFTGTGGGKQFYHGRLVVVDSMGSEIMPLVMPMQTQFYTTVSGAAGFALNALDSCTVYNSASNLTLTPSSGISTSASLSGSPPTFSQGVLNITLATPTPATAGSYVDVEANLVSGGANLPWLQYNWPYSGTPGTNFSTNPRGRGTFGTFKGNDRVVYQQEVAE